MPAHAKRIKIRRKELRQPDEFHTLTAQAVGWFEKHRELVLAIVGGAVVVTIAILAFGRYRLSQQTAAADAFRAAQSSLEAGRFAEAATAFTHVAADYPNAPFGRLAPLYQGHALMRNGDGAGAATAYTEYLGGSPPAVYLRQEGLDGLARAKEATGDTAAALDAYTQAGALEGPFRVDALLGAARLQEAGGHADAARQIYTQLLKEARDPELRALLVSKLPPGSDAGEPAGSRVAGD
jgi:hypothetical protein